MTRFVLEWVVTASLLILAVIALRALLGGRISARLRYALWAAVLARLLVPLQLFSLPVPELDIKSAATSAASAVIDPVLPEEPAGAPAIAAPLPNDVVVNYDATAAPFDISLNVTHLWDVLTWMWLAGAAVMTAAFLLSNLAFALRLRRVRVLLEGADCPLPVYLVENLTSPCLFGLPRPAVYVTAGAAQDPAMLCHILTHEYTHFRHGDHVWNLLRGAALAVHWWNPLVWLAVILSRRDCELACDEGTLKRLGNDERIAYGRTLMALITVKPRPGDLLRCATTMTGGQKSVFDRVARIARAPKRWFWAAVVAVIATALACVCAFGQAASVEPSEPLDGYTPVYAMSESGDGAGKVIVEGLGDAYVDWRGPDTSPSGGWLYFTDPTFCCPGLADKYVDGSAMWANEARTAVAVMLNANDGLIYFTVELDNGTILARDFQTEIKGATMELTDQEMVDMARALARLLTGAEDYYQSHSEGLSPQPVPELPQVPDVFADVLRGKADFVLHKNEPSISIGEVPAIFDPYDTFMRLQRYAVVDLLGDGTPEVLIYVGGVAGDTAGYLLLWDGDGQVHGEIFDRHGWRNRWFIDLKTDGTFECTDALGGAWWSSISCLRLTAAGGWTLHSQAVRQTPESSGNETDLKSFMDIGQEVTEQEFEKALEVQRAKPDVAWYEFPLKGLGIGPVSLDGHGTSMSITGLDYESAWW